ncbi:PadR family transcriptional regulator [Pediococcus acidilactici]|uniref:PadR family transcriptional regulator n=1 Tax=Pediococcus acidilactici TaxID=1254 RepID=UPI003CECF9FD
MSGKDMIAEFKNEISEFWTVSHSQLYPELQRMTDEGQMKWLTMNKIGRSLTTQ